MTRPDEPGAPMVDDFSALDESADMLAWLDPEPLTVIREQMERWLTSQVAGSTLLWVRIKEAPHWLSGGRPGDDGQTLLVRTGMACLFDLMVSTPDGVEYALSGVFTWVGFDLDTPERSQSIWIDLGGTLVAFGQDGKLRERFEAQP